LYCIARARDWEPMPPSRTRFAALQNTPLFPAGIALEKTRELYVVRYSRCVTLYVCVLRRDALLQMRDYGLSLHKLMMRRPCVTRACLMPELLSEERARRASFARALLVLRYSCFTLDAVRMLGSSSSVTDEQEPSMRNG
jgi:hypothetical protein